jgi:hypothetical protein
VRNQPLKTHLLNQASANTFRAARFTPSCSQSCSVRKDTPGSARRNPPATAQLDPRFSRLAHHVLDPLMLAKVRKFDYDDRDEAMVSLQD